MACLEHSKCSRPLGSLELLKLLFRPFRLDMDSPRFKSFDMLQLVTFTRKFEVELFILAFAADLFQPELESDAFLARV